MTFLSKLFYNTDVVTDGSCLTERSDVLEESTATNTFLTGMRRALVSIVRTRNRETCVSHYDVRRFQVQSEFYNKLNQTRRAGTERVH